MQQDDIQNYACLLPDTNVVSRRQLKSNEIKFRINNEYRIGQSK
ncbi:4225_t:CDS:1, partial [Gigaspora margarita]